ncbi:CPCC family cysteine-rich protein [Microbulbifer sp. ANSA001]|uniref:CPCC family cysteine-rich protein n=1 Tax=Microbulbifer sp. ANSA001 TaxID=3243358 RepID=UPI0040431D9E
MNEVNTTIECPCCGYLSLNGGEHGEICIICYWESDSEVGFRGTVPSVNNHGLSLVEARNNFDRYGACCEEMIQHVLPAEARKEYKHSSEVE